MSLSSNNEIYLMGDFNIDIKAGKLSNTKWTGPSSVFEKWYGH